MKLWVISAVLATLVIGGFAAIMFGLSILAMMWGTWVLGVFFAVPIGLFVLFCGSVVVHDILE